MSRRLKTFVQEHKTTVVVVSTLAVAYVATKLVQNAAEYGANKAIDAASDRPIAVTLMTKDEHGNTYVQTPR